jgi:hypothetical protein
MCYINTFTLKIFIKFYKKIKKVYAAARTLRCIQPYTAFIRPPTTAATTKSTQPATTLTLLPLPLFPHFFLALIALLLQALVLRLLAPLLPLLRLRVDLHTGQVKLY